MKLIDLVNFFQSPADRDVIARWTAPPGPDGYAVQLPQPPDPERFCFLALGDSGDSAGMLARESPQDAVARFMLQDSALPEIGGPGQFVLHTGDVVYMTGERRLYDRNFRRPYAAFLTPESTVDQMVFRLPFLPVPGNHDYYDFLGWAGVLTRAPLIGRGLAALARELFAFQVPQGGSDMGAAYMHAFIDPEAGKKGLRYEPGLCTRLPNRYYRFRVGSVDFFGLDSNTLESPPPDADLAAEREEAARRVKELERRARALQREIARDEEAVEQWLSSRRRAAAEEGPRVEALAAASREVLDSLRELAVALDALDPVDPSCSDCRGRVSKLIDAWTREARNVSPARGADAVADALDELDDTGDQCCALLEDLEHCFAALPEGPERASLLAAREGLVASMQGWRKSGTGPPPPELCHRLQELSAGALEVQRQLAVERRRLQRRPEDYDAAQLEWLRTSIAESVRDNPDGWRIVFLHQPLYTTIGDHSENYDVVGVRENLVPLLREHVHLVLAGHAHAFEWFRSTALPTTGLVVTGGGGQPWLWRSILDPSRFRRFRALYRSLRESGATECVAAGHGPPAPDGEDGALYHYVQVQVSPESLTVVPVGVRRIPDGYRRESPMPVYYVPSFPPEARGVRPPWRTKVLRSVVIRRGEPPQPVWD